MSIAKLAEDTPPSGTGCAVCRALASIPAEEAEGLRALLRNPGLRYSEISEWIANDPDTPLSLTSDALGKHARGGCSAKEKLR